MQKFVSRKWVKPTKRLKILKNAQLTTNSEKTGSRDKTLTLHRTGMVVLNLVVEIIPGVMPQITVIFLSHYLVVVLLVRNKVHNMADIMRAVKIIMLKFLLILKMLITEQPEPLTYNHLKLMKKDMLSPNNVL